MPYCSSYLYRVTRMLVPHITEGVLLQSPVLVSCKLRVVRVRAGATANGGALQRPLQLRPPYGAAPAPQQAQGPAQGALPAQGLSPPGAVLSALPGVQLSTM